MKFLFELLIVHGTIIIIICDYICVQKMKNAKIIPTFADDIGSEDLKVCGEYTPIKCGEDYAPSLIVNPPTLYCNEQSSESKNFTVMFFGESTADPDVNITLLWMVHNVPAVELRNGFHGQYGKAAASYMTPGYSEAPAVQIFFIYRQNGDQEMVDHIGIEGRKNFDPKNFAKERNLGNPVAATYFRITAVSQVMKNVPYSSGRQMC